jgi:hypothetical protein
MLISSIDCSPIMSADQPHLVGTVDELQEASVVTDDAASGIVTGTSPSLRRVVSSVSLTIEHSGMV